MSKVHNDEVEAIMRELTSNLTEHDLKKKVAKAARLEKSMNREEMAKLVVNSFVINPASESSSKMTFQMVDDVLKRFGELSQDLLAKGTSVKVSGLGVIHAREMAARKVTTPQGVIQHVPARMGVRFSVSRFLKEALNHNHKHK